MILIKISADDERSIVRARTQGELEGIRDMVIDLIERAKVLRSFGKTEKLKMPTFGWKEALTVLREVCGEANITAPPYPDYTWYKRVGSCIRRNAMDEKFVRELGEYARDHIRMPSSAEFIIQQHAQILQGVYDVARPGAGTSVYRSPELQLPEE